MFFYFFALGWFLDFARHAVGFVFMRNLCVEVKMGVFVQEKCWAGFFSGFYCYFWKSLSRSTPWEVYTSILYFYSSADYSVLTDRCPPLPFYFYFVSSIASFESSLRLVTLSIKLIYKWYSIDVVLLLNNNIYTKNGQKYNIQHIFRVFNSVELRLLWV